jgi:hypothetical protein
MSDGQVGKLPPEPKLKDFPDEESFLEARDSSRHRVGPILRMAEWVQASLSKDPVPKLTT